MKQVIRFSGIAMLAAAFVGGGAITASAQDVCADADGQGAAYTKFTELYPKTDLASQKEALNAAKAFVEKYGACEVVAEQKKYFDNAIPALEAAIKKREESEVLGQLFKRFDSAVAQDPAASKPAEVYTAGKEILAKQPDNINIILAMGLVGAAQSTAANNYQYTNDGLQYANAALSKVKGGAKFTKKNKQGEEVAGVFWTERTRPEATADLNYAVAYLTHFGKKDKTSALPLFYELTQTSHKDNPMIYGLIGDYYVEKQKPIAEQIRVKIEEQKKEGEAVEVKEAREEELKKLVALFNGYNERILDAYGRAFKVTKDTPANKAYRDNLYNIMKTVYQRRFDKETGLDAYISSTVTKPFPNPTSEVTPVSDPEPAKTTTSGATAVTVQPAATAKVPAAQPAATTKVPAANGKTATTTKPKRR